MGVGCENPCLLKKRMQYLRWDLTGSENQSDNAVYLISWIMKSGKLISSKCSIGFGTSLPLTVISFDRRYRSTSSLLLQIKSYVSIEYSWEPSIETILKCNTYSELADEADRSPL